MSDLLNLVIPTNITRLAPNAALQISKNFTGNGSEQGAYIGIPLVLFIILTLVIARRRRVTWVAFSIAVAAAVLSMGPTLHVNGTITTFELPDAWLQDLPFFHNLLPDRFASMMFLGVGLLVALGLNELKRFQLPVQVSGWALASARARSHRPDHHFPGRHQPAVRGFRNGLCLPAARLGDATVAPSRGPRAALHG